MTPTSQASELALDPPAPVHPAPDVPQDARSSAPRRAHAHGSPLASVARGALALLSTQPFTWSATILAAALVPRYLGAHDLGLAAVASSIAMAAGTVAALGMSPYLQRSTAAGAETAKQSSAAFMLMVTTSVVLALAIGIALPFAGMTMWQANIVRLSLLAMVLSTAGGVSMSLLLGRERHVLYAWLTAAGGVLSSLACVAVLVAGGGLMLFMSSSVVVAGLMLVVGWRCAGFPIDRSGFDIALWKQLIRGGAPFLATNMVTWVYAETNRFFLAALASSAAVGWHAAAYRIIAVPVFIPALVATPLLPVLSRESHDRAAFVRTFRHSFVLVLVLTFPIAGLMFGIAPSIPVTLGWPDEFHNSIPLMRILALQQPVVAIDMILGVALYARHRERQWFVLALIGAIASIILNLTLIPLFEHTHHNGAIGASLGTVAVETIIMFGALFVLPRGLVGRGTLWVGTRVLLASVAVALVTALLRPVFLPLAAVAAGATYVTLILAFRVIRLSELWTVRRFAQRTLASRSAAAGH